MDAGTRRRGLLIALALGTVYFVWGSTYTAIAFALRGLPPFLMAGLRFLAAGAILYAAGRLLGAGKPHPRQWLPAAAVGALLLLGGNGGVVWAQQHIPSGLAALLVTTMPLMMALIEWARPGGSRPGWLVFAGIFLGMAGTAVLCGPKFSADSRAVEVVGVGAVLFACLTWAAGSLYARTADLPRSLPVAAGMQMACGGGLLTLAGLASGELDRFDPARVTWQSVGGVAYLLVAGSLVAFTAYHWLLRNASPTLVSTYAFVNPVVAVLLGWLVLGEELKRETVAGGGVMVAAVALQVVGSVRRPAAPVEEKCEACLGEA